MTVQSDHVAAIGHAITTAPAGFKLAEIATGSVAIPAGAVKAFFERAVVTARISTGYIGEVEMRELTADCRGLMANAIASPKADGRPLAAAIVAVFCVPEPAPSPA